MKTPNGSESAPQYPLLVWDFDANQKILLRQFFWKCIESRIEAQPLITLLSTLSANGVVAQANQVSLEPKLFLLPDAFLKVKGLEEIQAAMSHVSSANSIIAESLNLYREVAREQSSSSLPNGGSPK